MQRRASRLISTAVILLAVLAALAAALTAPTRTASVSRARPAAGLFGNNAAHEAAFESRNHHTLSGEASRGGASTPAEEQVANRAYPRNYVDDKLALADRTAFRNLSTTPQRSSFSNDITYNAATAFAPGAWTQLGPTTQNVSFYASQFFNPATQTGPTTQESGRVTAIAVDPNCGAVAGNCRLWVATAGGGVWRTNDALAASPTWTPPPISLPTNSFGSLIVDPNDSSGNTLYAGSGEPNGSGDSEAGLGLFKTTNGGVSWSRVPGSATVATNRSIGAIAVDPTDPNRIYIGTDVARHGSASVNGGRRTPPNAPDLGVYVSTDGGTTFTLEADLQTKTPANPTPSFTGADWFQGGINKLELDPNNHNELYAGVQGYGIWRADQSAGATPDVSTWEQAFHTMNQTDFTTGAGDFFGDRTEFDLVDIGATTRAYVGDASDDWATDGDPSTPLPEVWRTNDIASINATLESAEPIGDTHSAGWTQLSDSTNGSNGYGAYGYCQNGQCGYDSFVASPAAQLGVTNNATTQDSVWLGGSMNYDELPAYQGTFTSLGTRSNGRAVIRSTNAGDATAGNVTWSDMTATLGTQGADQYPFTAGIHPDEHGIQFDPANPNIAFEVSDGGVYRVDATTPVDKSAQCDNRHYNVLNSDQSGFNDTTLSGADLTDCHNWLSAIPSQIDPINIGLNTLQFQSVSVDPRSAATWLGGTQDNGTWQQTPSDPTQHANEVVGGDGGQSGFDATADNVRYHNYFDATPEVNFASGNPAVWYDIYDTLQISGENQSFYSPFVADPNRHGVAYEGLQHVWRTLDNGGNAADLEANGCNAAHLDPFRAAPCGDWEPMGQDLTSDTYGDRAGHYVVAITRAPSSSSVMWAATRIGRVFITTNALDASPYVSWRRIDTDNTPGRFVTGIEVDPSNPLHAWISYTGYNAYTPSTPGHVFEVTYHPTTHTASFVDRSYNLGDQPVTGLQRDPATGDLYAATDFGVLRLPRGSTSWTRAGTNFPFVAVYGITISANAHRLYAATHGRGVLSVNLPKPPTVSITGPFTIQRGKKYSYTATASSLQGGPFTYAWTLPGTPAHASTAKATFTPTSLGYKKIKLTVTDGVGAFRTVTKTVHVVDTLGPGLAVNTPATVHLGQLTVISGRTHDPSGIKLVRIHFGDGTFVDVIPSSTGSFSTKHRYPHTGSFTVTVVSFDRLGNKTVRRVTATVIP